MNGYHLILKATESDKKKYLLPKEEDLEILDKSKRLEKLSLTDEDKYLVKLIKTQLLENWRKPLLRELNLLLQKYRVRP